MGDVAGKGAGSIDPQPDRGGGGGGGWHRDKFILFFTVCPNIDDICQCEDPDHELSIGRVGEEPRLVVRKAIGGLASSQIYPGHVSLRESVQRPPNRHTRQVRLIGTFFLFQKEFLEKGGTGWK